MDFNKVSKLELKCTRKLMEWVGDVTEEEKCQEATAAIISSLANCLVLCSHGGISEKDQSIEAISMAVNRATEHREELLEAIKVKIQGITHR